MAQAIAVSNARTATLTPYEAQRRKSIQTSLAGLAEARQASVSAETLKLYSSQLSEYAEGDVRAACREIAHNPRKEGETAFPELGKIIWQIKVIVDERRREQRSQAQYNKCEAWFWSWVTEQVEDSGKTEQQVLDSVKVSGYIGRKARNAI
jgi:hypothetical protein